MKCGVVILVLGVLLVQSDAVLVNRQRIHSDNERELAELSTATKGGLSYPELSVVARHEHVGEEHDHGDEDDHDHDGDGVPDHAPEDHEDDHDSHDHGDDDKEDGHDDHDHDGDGVPDHDPEDHEDEHDHSPSESEKEHDDHDDHDHDGDGVPDHPPEDHDSPSESEKEHDHSPSETEKEHSHSPSETEKEHDHSPSESEKEHDDHDDHDHDGDGVPDHSPEDHDDDDEHDHDHDHDHDHGDEDKSAPSPTAAPPPGADPSPSTTPAPSTAPTPSAAAACFPGDALVTLADGTQERMDNLAIGQVVMTADSTSSDVFAFTHKMSDVVNTFVRIEADGVALELTSNHYIPLSRGLTAAGAAQVGDLVTLGDGTVVPITAISLVEKRGLYNPHTLDGTMVVNGVVVSTYTTVVHPKLAHILLTIPRTLFQAGIREPLGGLFYNTAPAFLRKMLLQGPDLIKA